MRLGICLGLAFFAVGGCDVPTDLPRFESTFIVPTQRLAVPVTGRPVEVVITHDLTDADDLVSRARGGAMVFDIENPSSATGLIEVRVSSEIATIMGSLDARAVDRQRVPLTRAEVQALLGRVLTLRVSGTLCPSTGCAVVPAPSVVTVRARIELMLELGTEG